MNKAQLIEALTGQLGGDRRTASAAVEGIVDIVVRTVQAGENVTITGFGVFEKRARAARVARNPRTGETVPVAPTSVPAFRPGAQFKDVVSGVTQLSADAPAVKRSASSTRPATTRRKPRTSVTQEPAATTATPETVAAETGAALGPKTAAAKSAAAQAKADKPAKSGSKADKASKSKKPADKKKSSKSKK